MGSYSSKQKQIQFHIVSDKKEAEHHLLEAEKKDFYLEECQEDKANQLARSRHTYAANEMTDDEFLFFQVIMENAKEKIPIRLHQELSDVYIIQLMPSADGGMPHTRPDRLICYPNIRSTFSVETVIHELWHIHQREYPEWWRQVFYSLGWVPWTDGKLPLPLEQYRRYNPDTLDMPLWCYQKTWVPVPIFRDITTPKVDEVTIWFYHVTLKYHVKHPPKELVDHYPSLPPSAFEHPREMAAYLLSNPRRHSDCPGWKTWVETVGAVSLPFD